MRVLFSSTWGHGHVFPMVPLARALLDAGHDVLWATNEPAHEYVAAAGIDAVSVGFDADGVAAAQQRLRAEVAGLRPQDKAEFAFPHMFGAWATPPMVRDLLPLAGDWRPDLMVHEHAELASPLVGAVLGVPSVTHSFGGGVPASFLAAAGKLLEPLWAEHGVEAPAYAGCFTSMYLDICPPAVQSQNLDHIAFRQPLRPGLYSGELEGSLPAGWRIGTEPLLYLTLGTVHNDAAVLVAAVRGLANLKIQVLVSAGPNGDPAALDPLPANVRVERWIRQADVLPHCAAVVSHAGSGTFLGALTYGLPQLCLPQAADQFRNASRAVATGAGLTLHPDDATPTAVAEAAQRVLVEDRFRDAARGVADQIAAMPTPTDVVTVLEGLP